ncbi:hypothetical protein ACFY9F_24375 [Streptomyces sp. NPDC012421]|uniref:RapZ C-terminal domain-containing protein n=1 Tax=Streptomyces sp. NPDC012421 TaxID=3364832 RepID=UPI0036EB05C7
MASILITSHGTGHNDDLVFPDGVMVDTTALHNPPDDPAVRATLSQLTGQHPDVAAYVLGTPGAHNLIATALTEVKRRAERGEPVIWVIVHCYGGRHRSVAIAERLATELRQLDHNVCVAHRHIDRPLLPSRNPA